MSIIDIDNVKTCYVKYNAKAFCLESKTSFIKILKKKKKLKEAEMG